MCSSDLGDIRRVSAPDLLEWEWTSFPVSPVKFSYTLKVPAGTTGRAEIAALLTFVRNGKSGLVLAKPDPLKVERVGWHTADLDRSFTFSLFELLRVIELYNTRRGTVRTGAYQVSQGTEDGFTPDFDRSSGVQLPLAAYHSADYGRDGSINLLELLRMIDGPIAPLQCLSRRAYQRCDDCQDEETCRIRKVFAEVFWSYLLLIESLTLADIQKSADGQDRVLG